MTLEVLSIPSRLRSSLSLLLGAILFVLTASSWIANGQTPPSLDRGRAGVGEVQDAHSRRLVVAALDSEALYTIWNGLLPSSSGFWRETCAAGSRYSSDVDRVRAALEPLRGDGLYADVRVFESSTPGERIAEAYVVNLAAVAAMIEREARYFARHSVTPNTHPAELFAIVERLPRADRCRALGLLYGYPGYAVDFMVEKGIDPDDIAVDARRIAAGAKTDSAPASGGPNGGRRFHHVPTFSTPSSRFAWAVPAELGERDEDRVISRDAAAILAAYRESRAAIVDSADPVATMRACRQRWMATSGAALRRADAPPAPAAPAGAVRTLWGILATGAKAEHRMWCLVAGDQERRTHLLLDLNRDGRFDAEGESFAGEVDAGSARVKFQTPASALGDEHTMYPVSICDAGTISIGMHWRKTTDLSGCWREGPVTSPQFSPTPTGAPVIHFDVSGPLEILRYDVWPKATAGGRFDVNTVIGRRGLGTSSFAAVSLDDVLPAGRGLEAELRYVDRDGKPRSSTFQVMQRSCSKILFEWITIPADAAPGAATIRLRGDRPESDGLGAEIREQTFAIEIGDAPLEDRGESTPACEATGQAPPPASPDTRPSRETKLTMDFEDAPVGELPPGWHVAKTGFRAVVDDARAAPAVNGEGPPTLRSVRLEFSVPPVGVAETKHAYFGNLMRFVDAEPYRGKVVRVRASMFVDPGGIPAGPNGPRLTGDDTCLWFRVDRPGTAVATGGGGGGGDASSEGCFGRTDHQPLTPGVWETREIIGAVAADAESIVFGVALEMPGPAWIDEVTFEVIGDFLADPPGTWPAALARVPLEKARDPNLTLIEMPSRLLSTFFGREITLRAGVVTPPDAEVSSSLPICYIVHGFGGDHFEAWSDGAESLAAMRSDPSAPRMVYVYLDANCPFGHHEFADSPNNGPWCQALVDEFMPAIEGRLGGLRDPSRRFLTGHSSGGWSVLWLMIQRPELFGGCWATAPDPVDFRDFSGVDIYTASNLYRDEEGREFHLVLEDGHPSKTFEQYTREELAKRAHVQGIGGQMFSFDAVFSPRAWNGLPAPLYDRATGAIDPAVAKAWRRYDIGLLLRENWKSFAPRLAGKVHVWCGEWDTFALAGAVRLLRDDLEPLEPDPARRPDILLVPERDHFTLFAPHAELWPMGMMARIFTDMALQANRAGAPGPAR